MATYILRESWGHLVSSKRLDLVRDLDKTDHNATLGAYLVELGAELARAGHTVRKSQRMATVPDRRRDVWDLLPRTYHIVTKVDTGESEGAAMEALDMAVRAVLGRGAFWRERRYR